MTRKILEDIKLNTNHKEKPRTVIAPKEKEENVYELPVAVMVESKKIKEIPMMDTHSSSKYDFLKKRSHEYSTKRISDTPHMKGSKPFNRYVLLGFILALLVGGFYLFSTIFFKAKVTVVPKNKVFNIDGEMFTASKTAGIPFEVMIVEDKEVKNVLLTTSTDASLKAQGDITLYNEYSNKPQKISAGAFLSDDKGKSYKTNSAVTIPAYTLDKSGKVVAGQVPVSITSFLPGEAYNGSPNIFYVTTYKGTDKYKKIYGHVKNPLSGGSIGLTYTMDDADKAGILSNLASSKDRLLRKLNALVPNGYILYPNAVSYDYQLDNSFTSKTADATVELKGTLSAILLKKSEFTSTIIDRLIPDISKDEKLEITEPDLSVLTFGFENKDQKITKDLESFSFGLKGNVTFNWMPKVEELKNLLISKNKNEVLPIFKQDPGIATAGVSIIPFWSSKLPDTPEKISVILKK